MIPKEIEQEIKTVSVPPPVPIVTPEGEPARIDDYDSFMQFLMLASIASNTRKTAKTVQALYDHAKDLEGIGLTRLMELTITQKLQKCFLPETWQSCAIINYGDPNDAEAEPTLYVRFNSLYTDEIPVNKGESINHDMKTHKLNRLYLRCGQGETTSIKVLGGY